MKSNWTIGMKLTASCAVMLALICVLGFESLRTAGAINDQVVIATTKSARRLQLGGAIDTASSDMLAGMRGGHQIALVFALLRQVDLQRNVGDLGLELVQGGGVVHGRSISHARGRTAMGS